MGGWGGAGGGGGGAGGGGGGGGSGSFAVPFAVIVLYGGGGGEGGRGGDGGSGGSGGQGAPGGNGGGGGGAFEIVAQGRITFASSTLAASGGDGANAGTFTTGTGPGSKNSGLNQGQTGGGAGEDGGLIDGGSGGSGGAGGAGGDGGTGGRGGFGGGGGGGAGGTIKLLGTDLNAGLASVNVAGGTGGLGKDSAGGDRRADSGGRGRLIVGSNTALTTAGGEGRPGSITGALQSSFDGPRKDNPYITVGNGNDVTTANIAGLAGGADIFGLLKENLGSAVLIDDLSAVLGSAAASSIAGAGLPSDALLALHRMDLAAAGDNYAGFDMLVLVNLTDRVLATPSLGIAPTGAISVVTLGLQIDGVGTLQGLSALNPHAIWATLIPESQFDTMRVTLPGPDTGAGFVTLSAQQTLIDGATLYLRAQRPVVSSAHLAGLQAIALSPDGETLYALDATRGALAVVNADDLGQRQLFMDGSGGITGLGGAADVAASPDGKHVYVAAAADRAILVFSAGAEGNLSGAPASAPAFGFAHNALAISADGARVYAGGSNGIVGYSRDPANGLLAYAGTFNNVAVDDLAFSSDGALVYGVSRASGTLYVFNSADVSAPLERIDGIAGASAVAASADGRFVYVSGQDDNTVAVIERSGAGHTRVQTLANRVDGVRGLLGASDVALTPDGSYVLVTAAGGNELGVFSRNAITGELKFVQVLRNDVGGAAGLRAPAAVTISGDSTRAFVASAGLGGQNGGIVTLDNLALGAILPEPRREITTFEGIESLAVVTGSGSDTFTLLRAPGAEVGSVAVTTGEGADSAVVLDLGALTTLHLGEGADSAQLRSTRPGSNLVVRGDGGDDDIQIARTGEAARIEVFGDDGRDTVRVLGANLPLSATTIVHGDDPGTTPGDTLVFDPQGEFYLPAPPAPGAGSVRTFGLNGVVFVPRGVLVYDTFEGEVKVISAPIVRFVGAPYTITEGDSASFSVDVNPLGLSGELDGPVRWDIDGDGNFGDAFGGAIALTWAQLANLGLDDDGVYQIAARATNTDGFSAEAFTSLTILNAPPVLALTDDTAGAPVRVGDDYRIAFSAADPGDDRVLEWHVDWGDGSTETFGAGTSSASHRYTDPGALTVRVAAVDEDSSPHEAAAAFIGVTVAVDAGQISAGSADYRIAEGESVTLQASVVGTPDQLGWFVNGVLASLAESPTLAWSNLQAIGVDDQGEFSVVLGARYAGNIVFSAPVALHVANTAPAASFGASAAAVDEGGSAVVAFTGQSDPSAADTLRGFLYSYDFGNDGAFEIVDSAAASAPVPASYLKDAGTVSIRGRIRDQAAPGDTDPTHVGALDLITSLTVREVAPALIVDGAPSATEGAPYALTLSAKDPGSDAIARWIVDWNDGTVEVFEGPVQTLSHTFADDGLRTIGVSAIDEDGSYAATKAVSVRNVAPRLEALAATDVDEGGLAEVTGRIVDAGTQDRFRMTIDWGEGAPDVIELAAGTTDFVLEHRYRDDTPSATASDPFDVSLEVSDGDDVGAGSVGLNVRNLSPAIDALAFAAPRIDENALGVLAGTIADAGVLDSHVIVIDWNDGSSLDTIALPAGTAAFSATHRFLDDDPTATASDDYTVAVTVTDKDGGSGAADATVTVVNLAPVVTALGLAEIQAPGTRDTQLSGRFADVGSLDTVTVTLDWGDGSSAPAVIDPAARTLAASHRYTTANGDEKFSIVATIVDDDGGTRTAAIVSDGSSIPTAPRAVDDNATVDEDSTVAIAVLANDIDVNGDALDATVVSDPLHGTVVEKADGSFLYAPAANYFGADAFSYRVSDGARESNVATVSITVKPVNDAPVFTSSPDTSLAIAGELRAPADRAFRLSGADLELKLVSRDTGKYEVGFYRVDDDSGRIGGMRPGDAGYLEAALAPDRARVAFNLRSTSGAEQSLALDEQALYGAYLIVNPKRLATPGGSPVGPAPYGGSVYFSFEGANPEAYDHLRARSVAGSFEIELGFESFAHTGDKDYDDLVIQASGFALGSGEAHFTYDVQALDIEDASLTYQLIEAPDGAQIDPVSGRIDFAARAGSFGFVVGARDSEGAETEQPFTLTVRADEAALVRVDALALTPSGLRARFDRALDPAPIDAADIVLTDALGNPIEGALALDADNAGFTFIRTGGPLDPGSYTLRLVSGAQAFAGLDGDADGVSGDDYGATLRVAASNALGVIGIADTLAAEPGESFATAITLTGGGGIKALRFALLYDPAVISDLSATLAIGLPAGTKLNAVFPSPGYARFVLSVPPGLPAGAIELITLDGRIAASAAQGAVRVLDVMDVFVNGSNPANDDDGILALAAAPAPLALRLQASAIGAAEGGGAGIGEGPQEVTATSFALEEQMAPAAPAPHPSKLARLKTALLGLVQERAAAEAAPIELAPTALPLLTPARDSVRTLDSAGALPVIDFDPAFGADTVLPRDAPADRWKKDFANALGRSQSNPNVGIKVTIAAGPPVRAVEPVHRVATR